MKTRLGVWMALCASVSLAAGNQAEEIGRTMMQAMGGQDAWNQAHFVRFDFIVTIHGQEMIHRTHLWDKRTGRCRVEDKSATGEPGVVLFNSASRQGTAYVAGKALDGAATAKALEAANKDLLYDMYWLAMPWKWFDPGVRLQYLGRKKRGAQTFDVVELTFDHAGPTPGDRYQAFVSSATHVMEHWEYVLENGRQDAWDWEYVTTGGIKLGSNHTNGKGATIGMGKVLVRDAVDDAYFTTPGKMLAELK